MVGYKIEVKTICLRRQQSQKVDFWYKGHGHEIKVIDLVDIWKGFFSWVKKNSDKKNKWIVFVKTRAKSNFSIKSGAKIKLFVWKKK